MNTHEPISEYHANPAISHSKLEVFRRRPALYYRKYITKQIAPQEPGSAFRIGSASHCMVLEPATWTDRYAIRPEGIDRRTKAGKDEYAAFEAKAAGKVIIDQEEAQQVTALTEAVRNHSLASQLFAKGEPEVTWRTSGQLPLQCRTDWFNPSGCELSGGRPYVVDLKTVESLEDSSFGNFEKAAFRYGYHRQAGFYLPLITELVGTPVFDFFFVAVEKCEPFGVAVYSLSERAISRGQDETIEDLRGLKRCLDSNEWPNIDPVVRTLDLPKWYEGGVA